MLVLSLPLASYNPSRCVSGPACWCVPPPPPSPLPSPQYREIMQDEFLPEVTSSEKVVVHFYHKDFQR